MTNVTTRTLRTIPILLCASLALSACSVTPGDAARRGGHYPQAAKLYEVRANNGDALAAEKLGELYHLRPGLPEDRQRAVYWYETAVTRGQIGPIWSLGTIYRDGTGNVPRDISKAQFWFQKGADAGQHYSMYDLADLYASDAIEPRNDVVALMWLEVVTEFSKTYPKGNEGAQYILRDPKQVRQRLESRMTAADAAKSRELAKEWSARWSATHDQRQRKP